MTNGIYILANDVVYDQLVALLNSIEANAGKKYPICIIPYDDRLELVRREIKTRGNVQLFEDSDAIARWDSFAVEVWQTHPTIISEWRQKGITGIFRKGMHRRFSLFDGPFESYIYLDADILILNSLDFVFEQLNKHDWVVYDFQYNDPSHVYNVRSPKLLEVFPQERIEKEIFCAGFYATKRGIFDKEQREWLLSQLMLGESEILYPSAPDQTILNYMVMRSGISSYNFAHELPESDRTGCCVTSPHFQEQDYILYDKGNRLTYLHYIGLFASLFTRLCAGENIGFPYRDLFLHYRYLYEPEKRPKFNGKPKAYNQPPNLATKLLRKLNFIKGI